MLKSVSPRSTVGVRFPFRKPISQVSTVFGSPKRYHPGLAGSLVGAVAEIRRTDHLKIFIGKHIQRRTNRVVRAAHDEGRPLRQFDREMLERSRNQQIFRFHRDRLTVGIHLIQEELDRLLERIGTQRRTCAGEQVFCDSC